jgi:glutamate/tyrosine decarboxylase-like PLP-dependent enzyme
MSAHPPGTDEFLAETSLDPVDWAAFRASAHRALDDAIDFLRGARERPVWRPVPQDARAALSTPLPQTGQSLDQVYREFTELILPYSTGNTHPRFFGWVHGTGMATGIVAEMLAAALNANCGGRDHGAIYVEHAVLSWFKELFQLPDQTSGLIVSGTSIANLIALTIARNAGDVESMRADGLQERPGRLTAYTSAEAHECLVKGMEVLGLGAAQLRRVPVDEAYRIDLGSLSAQIEADRAAGYRPFCVIGTAGTVNTAAVDDLVGLAEICAEKKLWFHVDGAFGALAMMSEELRPKLKGIERADSIAFDFHKWMHVPYDAGCILVRHGDLHRASFSMRPVYLSQLPRGLAGGRDWPCEFGLELSRGFRALKIWFALKEHGSLQFGRLIEQNCAQARYLAAAIAGEPELELLAPVSLNIVCFRYGAARADEAELDALNQAIVEDIQEAGIAAPSTTRLHGRLAIRVNITNHRTRRDDLDLLLRSVLEAGRRRQSAPANLR